MVADDGGSRNADRKKFCDLMETLFCDRVREMSAPNTVTVKISKTKTKRLTVAEKSDRNLIYRWQRLWRRFWSWRWRRLRTKRRYTFARSKISSSTSAMLFATIFPPAQSGCNFNTFSDQTIGSAIVCDYMESTLFTIICDLWSTILDRLRSYGNQA